MLRREGKLYGSASRLQILVSLILSAVEGPRRNAGVGSGAPVDFGEQGSQENANGILL